MNSQEEICLDCNIGTLKPQRESYHVALPDNDGFDIPDLSILRCDNCGAILIPASSSRQIEVLVDEYQETFSSDDVQEFLDFFHLDQSQAAEALGMGNKTFHRWVKGSQKVSRSMGYYLRALEAHPQVFKWVLNRSWRHQDDVGPGWHLPLEARFPALLHGRVFHQFDVDEINPAKGLLMR